MKLKTLVAFEAGCGLAVAFLALIWYAETSIVAQPTVDVDINVPHLSTALPGERVTFFCNNSGIAPRPVAIKEGLVIARSGITYTIRVTPEEAKRLDESGPDIGMAHLPTLPVYGGWFDRLVRWLRDNSWP